MVLYNKKNGLAKKLQMYSSDLILESIPICRTLSTAQSSHHTWNRVIAIIHTLLGKGEVPIKVCLVCIYGKKND